MTKIIEQFKACMGDKKEQEKEAMFQKYLIIKAVDAGDSLLATENQGLPTDCANCIFEHLTDIDSADDSYQPSTFQKALLVSVGFLGAVGVAYTLYNLTPSSITDDSSSLGTEAISLGDTMDIILAGDSTITDI